jgi:hypothetical protein
MQILVVEDSPVYRELLSSHLQEWDFPFILIVLASVHACGDSIGVSLTQETATHQHPNKPDIVNVPILTIDGWEDRLVPV